MPNKQKDQPAAKDKAHLSHPSNSSDRSNPSYPSDASSSSERPARPPRKPALHPPRDSAARVLELAEVGCTVEEIAAELGCAPDELRARHSAQLSLGISRLRAQLRRLLLDSAQEGKVPAQIWLGRLYLGRIEEQRADAQQSSSQKELSDMTTSEMLEDYLQIRTRGRKEQ